MKKTLISGMFSSISDAELVTQMLMAENEEYEAELKENREGEEPNTNVIAKI